MKILFWASLVAIVAGFAFLLFAPSAWMTQWSIYLAFCSTCGGVIGLTVFGALEKIE